MSTSIPIPARHRASTTASISSGGPEPTVPRALADSTVRTYRCLRLSLVALVALLLFSVWLERLTGAEAHRHLGSISAYFYTPARGVFVAALVALGLGLVVLAGRRGTEDTALNLAGMLAPVVAFVPTPRAENHGACVPEAPCTVPAAFVPGVVNNVWSLAVLGLIGLAWGCWTLTRRSATRSCRIGIALALALWIGFVGWFLLARDSFLDGAHFAAAVPLFGLITAVAVVNARDAGRRHAGAGRTATSYAATYALVAALMALALLMAVVFALVQHLGLGVAPAEWVLWVEVVLLVAFGAFWIAQTLDYWADGVPQDAAEC